jgi:PAS domain S-box-containing protein
METALRKTDIAVVGDIPWGTHLCHFYETQRDLLDTVVPYFKAGLEHNEFCLWTLAEPLTEQEAKSALRQAVPDLDCYLAERRIEMLPHDEWYPTSGAFDLHRVMNGWYEKLAHALAEGYAGMRASGDAAGWERKDWKDFSAYEHALNASIGNQRMIMLCTYPLALSSAADIFDVARAHQCVIAKRHGEWEVFETPALKQAKAELQRLKDELEQRVVERTMALQASEERFRRYFELGLIGMAITSPTQDCLEVNDEMCKILGYERHELLRMTWTELSHPDDLAADVAQFQRVLAGEIDGYTMDKRWLRKDGQVIHSTISVKCLRRADGSVDYFVALLQDITERKQLEVQLRETQKMEAIGVLAGGIAHDFNNILAAIIGFTELAQREMVQASPAWEYLHAALTAGQRAKDLVQQILTFSRHTLPTRQPLRLHLLVHETLRLLRATLPSTIDIRTALNTTSGTVLADPTQLQQVLINLGSNAAHAMHPMGGVLEVGLDEVDIPSLGAHPPGSPEKGRTFLPAPPGAESYPSALQPGPYLRLTVRDTGAGMSPDVTARIFEPFFTTKRPGEGIGMGLAVVHGIVTSHGGTITIASAPGQGTTVAIYLPRIADVPPLGDHAEEPLPRGDEHILVVDDEEVLAHLYRDMLASLGYEVTVYTRSPDALAAFRAAPQVFDLVITDQTMPYMTGDILIRQLWCIRPDIPVILCTGYSPLIAAEHTETLEIDALLMKPVTVEDFARTIRQVFARRSALQG